MNTLLIIALSIYLIYIVISICLFGIPESLSNTYYLYKEKYRLGVLFPIMMALVVGCMMPTWLVISEGSMFQFLSFLSPACLLFVGAAPMFKNHKLENRVHSISAYIAAACALLWVILVTPYWWLILVWFAIITCFALITSTYKTCLVFWLEQIAFGATFTALLI